MLPDLVPAGLTYLGPTPQDPRACIDCGADLTRERHVETCPQVGEIRHLAFDPHGRRLEFLLAAAHRRAVAAWLKVGRGFR